MSAKDLLTVTGLALLDSLNISLILGTIYLMLNNKRPLPKVLVFVGVFYAVYVAAGAVLTAGAATAGSALGGSAGKVIQLGVGVLLFLYGIFAETERRENPAAAASTGYPATVGLAVTVAGVEVATALPYLAAISVVSQSGLGFPARVLILLGYNLVVVAPCLVAATVYHSRLKTRLERFAEKRKAKKNDRKGLLLLCIVAGFYIAGDALTQLEFFGLVDLTDEQRRQIHSY